MPPCIAFLRSTLVPLLLTGATLLSVACAEPLPGAAAAAAGTGDAAALATGDTGASDTATAADSAAPETAATASDSAAADSSTGGAAGGDAPAVDAPAADTNAPAPDAAPACAAKFGTPTDKKVSTSGIYTVELDGPLQAAPGTIQPYQIRVTAGAAGEAVVQQAIAVTYIHTQMGHGGLKTPSVEELCNGIYKVKNVQPSMGGTWALGFTLAKSDVAKFSIVVK